MALTDNLLSYYKLDEASGNALDAHGTDELTDLNSVGSAVGKVGNARDFSSNKSFYKANVLNISGDFSLQAWVKGDAFIGLRIIVSRRSSSSYNTENYLLYMFASKIYLDIGFTDNTRLSCISASITTGVWYHVVATHNATTKETKVYLNNAAPVTATYVGKTLATTAADGFRIGAQYGNADVWDGLIDEVGVWDRVLTDAEVEDLYNSGNGLAYENFAPGIITTPPTATLGITGYAPTVTGDPDLFEYISTSSTFAATASTSIAITSTPPVFANIALLLLAFDNSGTGADGDYSQVTGVSDTKGNSWHKLAEHSNTNGGAGNGATVSAWYCEVDPNTIESTVTTATFSSSIAGRNAAIVYCRSETLSLYAAEILTAATDASTSYGSLSTSLAAKNRMYVRVCAQESDTTSGFTPTTGFTGIVTNVQAGSGANMGLRAELKIATSASETSNPTSSFSSDTASVFLALEADAAGGTGYTTAINTYSMTSDTATNDKVTQVVPHSIGANDNTADEVTQITPVSIAGNNNTADEVTQIVMYSITNPTWGLAMPTTVALGITGYAPTVTEGLIGSVTVPTTEIGWTSFSPSAETPTTATPDVAVLGITGYAPTVTEGLVGDVTVPTTNIGIDTHVPQVSTQLGGDCCCCCWDMTVTVSVRFSARNSVR